MTIGIAFVLVPALQDEPLSNLCIHIKGDRVDVDDETFLESEICRILQTDPTLQGYCQTLLLRPTTTADQDGAGLYAFHVIPENYTSNNTNDKSTNKKKNECENRILPNIRATRLSMAMGQFANRFYGNVLLGRCNFAGSAQGRRTPISVQDVEYACCMSADLRLQFAAELEAMQVSSSNNQESRLCFPPPPPTWLAQAAHQNYLDGAVLDRFASVMSRNFPIDNDDDDDDQEDNSHGSTTSNKTMDAGDENDNSSLRATTTREAASLQEERQRVEFVANSPLCLHCRRPAKTLCPSCHGAYFCDPPRTCRTDCWSHDCLCNTWKCYTRRRVELSTFPGLGAWHMELQSRPFQLSELPYETFVTKHLGIVMTINCTSWWTTEMDGWKGGESESAKHIHVTLRHCYESGFAPIADIPPERRLDYVELLSQASYSFNDLGLLRLESWEQYYQIRGLPKDSPAALLLTFPLTLYYAIQEYGQVPCTVARMLKRPLRIHIVGAEKEMNFLDLFKEVSYLLPPDFSLELVFVVRQDMLPETLKKNHANQSIRVDYLNDEGIGDRLHIYVESGTYGDSLDPQFDCGSGPPDMVMAFNAGLYAYDSWRSVIQYLDREKGVVAVFSDYNELSGVQCASLGGEACRNSLTINPFRQPRAMPVYSMNLPQMSNGFLYVWNEQKDLDT